MKKAKTMALGAAAMSAGIVSSAGFPSAEALCEGSHVLPSTIERTQWLGNWTDPNGTDVETRNKFEGYFSAPNDSLYGFQSSGDNRFWLSYYPANNDLKARGGWISMGGTSWTWGTTYTDTSCCSTTVPVVFSVNLNSVASSANPDDAVYGVDIWETNGYVASYGEDAVRWRLRINDVAKNYIGAAIDECVVVG